MKILVLGGSYFLGKCFVNMAKNQYDVTVLNRGNRPMDCDGIHILSGDRHDETVLAQLDCLEFEVIVDFCAYEKNDIASVMRHCGSSCKQYIFISTCDVYPHGTGVVMKESNALEQQVYPGETGAYILGKVELEKELFAIAQEYHIAYTSIRPAFIYGPNNYAPREGIYFHWMKNAGQIIHPEDATGEFQMVFVEDVANGILNAIDNENAYNQVYNFTPEPMLTYERFADTLQQISDREIAIVSVPISVIMEKQIPLPFPLTKEESNWYDGSKGLELIGEYTPLHKGLSITMKCEL